MLQSKDYIKFADRYSVEVISFSRLDEAIQKGERKAQTYKGKDGREYLVEFPNLTVEEMLALNRSKASRYNDTGKIPFTAIVDPHTEEEMWRHSGGLSASMLQEAVKDAWKELRSKYGDGIDRKTLRLVDAAVAEAAARADEGDYCGALAAIQKAAKKAKDAPQKLQARLARAREGVVDKARAALDALETRAGDDPRAALRELTRLRSKLRGTGLEDRAQALLKQLKES